MSVTNNPKVEHDQKPNEQPLGKNIFPNTKSLVVEQQLLQTSISSTITSNPDNDSDATLEKIPLSVDNDRPLSTELSSSKISLARGILTKARAPTLKQPQIKSHHKKSPIVQSIIRYSTPSVKPILDIFQRCMNFLADLLKKIDMKDMKLFGRKDSKILPTSFLSPQRRHRIIIRKKKIFKKDKFGKNLKLDQVEEETSVILGQTQDQTQIHDETVSFSASESQTNQKSDISSTTADLATINNSSKNKT